jgi:hypothetical protein
MSKTNLEAGIAPFLDSVALYCIQCYVSSFQTWCQALHILLQYLMVANYMWMFCEGLHLHLALVVVFVKDRVVMRWFHAIGWGLPLILTVIYAGVRGSRPDDSQRYVRLF